MKQTKYVSEEKKKDQKNPHKSQIMRKKKRLFFWKLRKKKVIQLEINIASFKMYVQMLPEHMQICMIQVIYIATATVTYAYSIYKKHRFVYRIIHQHGL